MTIFLIIVALLIAAALSLVLPPLLQPRYLRHPAAEKLAAVTIFKQQLEELDADLANGVLAPECYEQGRLELEQRLLDETGPTAVESAAGSGRSTLRWAGALTVGLGLPAAVAVLYLQIGSPAALLADTPQPATVSGAAPPHQMSEQEIELTATRLMYRLKRNPRDADGWAMLARSYGLMQRFNDGAAAFAKAVALTPNDAQLIADYADTLAMTQGRRFDGEPAALIERALALNPANLKALALAGSAQFEAKSYARAVVYWERLLERLPPGAPLLISIRGSIAEARARGGLEQIAHSAASAMGAAIGDARPTPSRGGIKGTVSLIPELAGKVSPTERVVVFARALAAPGKVLAVVQRQVKDLPFGFVLDDSTSLLPEIKLSRVKEVVVGARVLTSNGDANQSGDLVSRQVPVMVGGDAVDLSIRGIVR